MRDAFFLKSSFLKCHLQDFVVLSVSVALHIMGANDFVGLFSVRFCFLIAVSEHLVRDLILRSSRDKRCMFTKEKLYGSGTLVVISPYICYLNYTGIQMLRLCNNFIPLLSGGPFYTSVSGA